MSISFKISFIIFVLFTTSCNFFGPDVVVTEGVSAELATYRKQTISKVRYKLHFLIPDSAHEKVSGRLSLKFNCNNVAHPLIMDFGANAENIKAVIKDKGQQQVEYSLEKGHLIIPFRYLQLMDNYFTIDFVADEKCFAQNDTCIFSKFDLAMASTCFPCFNQPDLKALFELKLDVPSDWYATSITAAISKDKINAFNRYTFEKTDSIDLRMFSFVIHKIDSIIEK